MSIPMNNINQGGYAPAGFGPGYSSAPTAEGYNPAGNYGFMPGNPAGYAPVPQAPAYGEGPSPAAFAGQGQPIYQGQGGLPNQPPYQPGFGSNAYVTQPMPSSQPGMMVPGQPITHQGDWMSIPIGIPNCPRGLEYLTSIDQLLVKQKVELLEAFTGFETNNKYSIKNALGQKVYYAVEENDCCTRNICGPSRPFDMKVFDNFRNEVIHMHRPLACSSCLFPCCLQSLEVSAPPGNVIGSIEQEWSICSPSFRINNHIGDTVLRIEGPFCTFSICGAVEFDIVSLTGEKIGKISKQWSGLAREIFTDADFFGLTFPLDLDVRMKAVLLGATFLIDAMFFEKSGNRETDRLGMF